MSQSKDLKRARKAAHVPAAPTAVAAQSAPVAPPPVRAGFSITITWNPGTPDQANYNILANEAGEVRDGDILNALQITRDDVLSKTVAALARQQLQAEAQSRPQEPGTDGRE